MASESLHIPEEHLGEFVAVIRTGLTLYAASEEVSQSLSEWCEDIQAYLDELAGKSPADGATPWDFDELLATRMAQIRDDLKSFTIGDLQSQGLIAVATSEGGAPDRWVVTEAGMEQLREWRAEAREEER